MNIMIMILIMKIITTTIINTTSLMHILSVGLQRCCDITSTTFLKLTKPDMQLEIEGTTYDHSDACKFAF